MTGGCKFSSFQITISSQDREWKGTWSFWRAMLERERRRALRPHQVKQAARPFQNISGTAWNVLIRVCPDLPLDCVTDTQYSYKETHALTRHRHIARNCCHFHRGHRAWRTAAGTSEKLGVLEPDESGFAF